MSYHKSILICGGDKRQKYMCKYMDDKGLNVSSFALYENDKNVIDDIKKYDVVILPVPITRDGEYLNSEVRVKLDDILNVLEKSQIVLGGMCSGTDMVDYFNEESFQMQNALPTAEGALQIAMENTDITINQSKCAIFGYGRIAKILAHMLKNLGASVTVFARKIKDIETAKMFGFLAENINTIEDLGKFDIIFNTVPQNVIDTKLLDSVKNDTLLIELASKPYGIDMDAAGKLSKRVIMASGLPGKVAPKTAGKILCDVIMDILVRMEV